MTSIEKFMLLFVLYVATATNRAAGVCQLNKGEGASDFPPPPSSGASSKIPRGRFLYLSLCLSMARIII